MKTAIVVLGAPNKPDGRLSVIAKARCDKAYAVFRDHQHVSLLCTGGFGSFNKSAYPHGELTKRYLVKQGIPVSRFLAHAPSRFTFEDATLAQPILDRAEIKKVLLVSSEFHIERVHYVFRHIMPLMEFECVPAVTPLPAEELALLRAHEQQAMLREEQNILSYKKAAL